MIYLKIHEADNGSLVAMCDSSLLDRILEEGDIVMDLKTYGSFYKGELLTKEKAKARIAHVEDLYSANIVGEESIAVALETRIIEKENIKSVQRVPYAQAYKVDVK